VISKDGTVLQNVNIVPTPGQLALIIEAKNVTVRNVQILGADYKQFAAIFVTNTASNVVIDHVSVAGADTGLHAVGYDIDSQAKGPVEISNSHLWNAYDPIQGSYGLYVHDNFIEDNATASDAHVAGFQCDGEGGCHVTVRHNTVLGIGIALALYADFGNATDSTFDDNLVRGGSYSIYGGGKGATGIHITNNRIARNAQYPHGGLYGPFGYCFPNAPGADFSGNVWDDNGKGVAP
jgi:hypothetical protein